MTRMAELAADAKAVLGEGPSWDAAKHVLYWVDIEGCAVHEFHPGTGENRTINVGQRIGAVVPSASGGCMAAMQHGFYRLNMDDGSLEAVGDPESDLPDNRFNDGKCDPAGRFWAGTMSLKGEEGTGSLYMLDTEGKIHKKWGPVTTSNGLAWSPDRRVMYYIDTPTRKVTAFDFDPESGHIENPRTAVAFPEGEGYPDGMTIDSEGMIWVAHWDGWKVSRFDPRNGERLEEIRVPAARVTSCCFGGDGLGVLYITTARIGLGAADLADQPHAGGLFRIETEVRGTSSIPYAQ